MAVFTVYAVEEDLKFEPAGVVCGVFLSCWGEAEDVTCGLCCFLNTVQSIGGIVEG